MLYSFSCSACANFGFSEKETWAHFRICAPFFAVSRGIDIALDVADNTLFELDYFIKSLEALEFN